MEFNLNLNWDERVAYLTENIHQSSEFLDLLTSLILEEVPTSLLGIISCWECLKVTVFSPQELKENTIIMTGLAEVMPQQCSRVASLRVERMEYGWIRFWT